MRSFLTVTGCLLLISWHASSQIFSDFTSNDEGWTAPNADPGTFTYNATGGNPSGHLSADPFSVVGGSGNIYLYYYFIAPGKFTGNRSDYYNGTLQFDVQQSSATTPSTAYAEVILSAGRSAIYYYPTTPFTPAVPPSWTTFSVRMSDASGFWKTSADPLGPVATESDIRFVLTNLTGLEIRGLYRDGNTVVRLDNVNWRPSIIIDTQPVSATVCSGATATLRTQASNNPNISYRWQLETGRAQWTDLTNTGGYSGATTRTLSINTANLFGAGRYRCRISGTGVEPELTAIATVDVLAGPDAPSATGNSSCGPATLALTATGGSAGQYRWYTISSGGTAIAGQTSGTFITPSLSATTTYYVSVHNGTCESARTPVTATINTVPSAPTVTNGSTCGPSAVDLSASGGSAGQYRWYTVSSGGTAIAGESSDTYKTPSLSATTTYYVSVDNGTCESSRTAVTATVHNIPAAPTVQGASECGPASLTLSASGGSDGQYRWYDAATGGTPIADATNGSFTTPTLDATTAYYVSIHDGNCESARTEVVAEIPSACSNAPPVIASTPLSTQIEGVITLDLSELVSDEDGNLDLSSLVVTSLPPSGATAVIGNDFQLIVDYRGVSFSGMENITVQVCDASGACTQQVFSIQVVGEIVVRNAFSPNGDAFNEKFIIEHVEKLQDTRKNRVKIFNRWGDVVWEASDYNNTTVVFTGKSKSGNDLPGGTYYFTIDFPAGRKSEQGFMTLRK